MRIESSRPLHAEKTTCKTGILSITPSYPQVSVLVIILTSLFFCLSSVRAQEQEGDRLFSLEFRDEEIRTVLKVLAQESEKNIIIPDSIKGKVTLSLNKITLNDALDVMLKSHGLTYISEKGVIRIVKPSEVERAEEELFTDVVVVNYARATDLTNQVKNALSPKGTVSSDQRTNSFIIKDTKIGIENAKRLIEKLDPQIPQVLIEARIVEASDNFSRSLGIQWGGSYSADAAHGNPLGFGFPNSLTVSGSGVGTSPSGNNFAVNMPATNPTAGLGFVVGSINNNTVLDIRLSAAEKSGDVKIVSSPKVTTVNNKPAMVSSGVEFKIKAATITGGTSSDSVSANTSLTVTPQVSADEYILLAIEASRDEPDFSRTVDGVPGILRKRAQTTVLVKNGETTVIGGLYRNSKGVTNFSVPFLSKIPIIGWLFRSKDRVEENEELMIFITPQILKKQG